MTAASPRSIREIQASPSKTTVASPVTMIPNGLPKDLRIHTGNCSLTFAHISASMLGIRRALYHEAVASLNGETPDIGWDDLTEEEADPNGKDCLSLKWGDPDSARMKAQVFDPAKVAKSTPEVQRFFIFNSMFSKLVGMYYRWTLNRGLFKILDQIWSKVLDDFETITDPSFVSVKNRQRFFSLTKPEDVQMRRFDAIGELLGQGKDSWSKQNFGRVTYGQKARPADEHGANAESTAANFDTSIVHMANEFDPTEETNPRDD